MRADREKRRVALSSLVAAVVLTSLKLAVGLWTNSLGVLAEAAHSGLDLVAAAVTLWAVTISSRPADRDHTYGHGKFENLSALIETLLLLVTCVWIVYEAVQRLFLHAAVEVDASVWALLVVMMSILVDLSRSRALRKVAKRYQSQALEADALHFSTDIWSSVVVLFGLLAVREAQYLKMPWLVHADTVAALGVAMIVVWVGLQLGKKSVDDLLDRVPDDYPERVTAAAEQVPGVEAVTQVRMRRSGPEVFGDVVLAVDRGTPLEKAHEIADQAEQAVRSVFPKADVVVHVEPVAGSGEDLTTTTRVVAARYGLGAHGMQIYEDGGQRLLELHVEVPESLNLGEAHQLATQFEQSLRQAMPGVDRIVSHLEPAGGAAALRRGEPASTAEIRKVLADFLRARRLSINVHHLNVQTVEGKLTVSFHCRLDPAIPITAAHDFTIRLEEHLRRYVPNMGRVVIHVEPAKGE